jgi:hypothetical protein
MAPKFIDGLGPANLIPKRIAGATLSALGAEEGFVLSRVDGQTTLGQICLLVPFPEEQTAALLRKLWEAGAIDVPGLRRSTGTHVSERAQPAMTPAEVEAQPVAAARAAPKPIPPPDNAHELEIAPEQQLRIDTMLAGLEIWNAFELLELTIDADDKEIKRAYFRLSKEFHPDRYFKKRIGDYKDRLSAIFVALKDAFDVLTNVERRAAYIADRKLGPAQGDN